VLKDFEEKGFFDVKKMKAKGLNRKKGACKGQSVGNIPLGKYLLH
jgi:hypothetical protein